MQKKDIELAANWIKSSSHITAFTGAGISVESGIPPFRGRDGIWGKYDPKSLELSFFYENPEESWQVIRQIFYQYFGVSEPNDAHHFLAALESMGYLKAVITQNIDNLHHQAGNSKVIEFHGNSHNLVCISCKKQFYFREEILEKIPPLCESCGSILKPDFIFFGETIPEKAFHLSILETELADLIIVIGTTGEVYPAASIPITAKRNGCKIIEINMEKTVYSGSISDIFLKGKATDICNDLLQKIKS